MADERLAVLMGDRVAGMLTRGANNLLRFDYDDAYRRAPGATPLSLSMPLRVSSHADTPASRRVAAVLWGLLPDNDDVLDGWARHYAVRRTSPFFLLATPVGEDCAGAVRFCAPDHVDRLLGRAGSVAWLTEAQVADRIRTLRRDATAWLGPRFTGAFSLAGAQPKTALHFADGRWGEASGRVPTTHIIKPGSELPDHDLVEHLSLVAAGRAGLIVATSRFARFGDQTALVVSRYDRAASTTGVIRVHQEDLCQAFGTGPDRKYQRDGGPSPTAIAALLRGHMRQADADRSVARFLEALIWNWIIAGTDAHAKNYSLLLSGSSVRLAPLYDVASILPYAQGRERDLQMSMRLGGTYDLWPARDFWPRAATELGLRPDAVRARVRELADIAPAAFSEAADDPAIVALRRPLVAQLVDRIADRARRCASVVAT
jgi:serine/threonine-protein kinase HipA